MRPAICRSRIYLPTSDRENGSDVYRLAACSGYGMSWVPARWKHVYRRLRSMERDEIADRVRQQAIARLDWLRYKAGSNFAPQLAETVSTESHFFFSPGSVPALSDRLRELFPETADRIVQRA